MENKSNNFVSLIRKGFVLLIGILLIGSFLMVDQTFAASGVTNSSSPGFFQHYFVDPFTVMLNTVASWFHGNYGISIIIVTFCIRLIIMPLMLKSSKSQMQLKDKMAVIQPELIVIQDKLKAAKTSEEKMKIQQEMMKLYKENDINHVASIGGGCLPLLIQMPILMGFYYAIRGSAEISSHTFLWFNLGGPDMILTACAVAIYFFQAKISLIGMSEEQRKQMAIMSYISPIMIGIISFTAPAALPLYWIVGGTFTIIQTLIIKKLYSSKPVLEETIV